MRAIGHFRVTCCLGFKTSLSAKMKLHAELIRTKPRSETEAKRKSEMVYSLFHLLQFSQSFTLHGKRFVGQGGGGGVKYYEDLFKCN